MEDEALAWATRLDAGDLTPADLAVLDAWLAAAPAHAWRLAHYQQFYAQLHGTLPALAAAGALPSAEARPLRRRWLTAVATFAGVAALVTLAALLWLRQPRQLVTQPGQRQSITLADGSRTDLNASSRLAISLRDDRRVARLEQGEAVFHVAKDPQRPFWVETPAGSVRVTGTVFNVRLTSAHRLEVTVLEGSVAVQPVAASGLALPAPPTLGAGDQLLFDPATSAVHRLRPAAVEDVVAWREGKVVFAGTGLADAAERYAAYHGREISVAPVVAGLTLGGRYALDDLDQFLGSLAQVLPVRIIRQPDGRVDIVANRGP